MTSHFDPTWENTWDVKVVEPDPNEQYPFFVYGTLKRDGRLAELIENVSTADPDSRTKLIGTAVLPGSAIVADNYAIENEYERKFNFPFLSPKSIEGVEPAHGELVLADEEVYGDLLNLLDRIEGVYDGRDGRMYHRRLVQVMLDDGSEQFTLAWAYIGSRKAIDSVNRLGPDCIVQDGNWQQEIYS